MFCGDHDTLRCLQTSSTNAFELDQWLARTKRFVKEADRKDCLAIAELDSYYQLRTPVSVADRISVARTESKTTIKAHHVE